LMLDPNPTPTPTPTPTPKLLKFYYINKIKNYIK